MTTPTMKNNKQIRELTQTEGRELLNRQTQRYLGMSAEDFIQAWENGEFNDDLERPEIVRLVMLIPLAV